MNVPRITAIITARGGSKGLPRKNVLPLGGIPLIAHSIKAALGCPLVSGTYVTTDDAEIKQVSLEWGARVIDRPAELAGDTVKSAPVVRHALGYIAAQGGMPEYFVLLQPTSPLRTSAHLTSCIEMGIAHRARCTVSVTECEHHPYKTLTEVGGSLSPLKDWESIAAPRQLLPKYYRVNGAIYFLETALFMATDAFVIHPVTPHVMPNEASVDIDSRVDMIIAEALLQNHSPARV